MTQVVPAPPEALEDLQRMHVMDNSDATPRDDAQVIADFEKHVNPSMASLLKFMGFDSIEVAAQGCIVTDSQGRRFLDCLGGYGTMSVGHSHPRVVEAVKNQLDKIAFSSRVLFNAPQAALAKKLAEITPVSYTHLTLPTNREV